MSLLSIHALFRASLKHCTQQRLLSRRRLAVHLEPLYPSVKVTRGFVKCRANRTLTSHPCVACPEVLYVDQMAFFLSLSLQMQGLEALRRDGGGGQDAIVAAPKIRRFCEGYLALVGRLIASRLMLELSPFMDSSVATTSSAPRSSSRQQLIATRQKLDEV